MPSAYGRSDIASRVTATRVAVGTVLLPGIGTIIGALAKKNRSKVYLATTVPDDDLVLVEVRAKKETKAREFALRINKAARAGQERNDTEEGGDGPPTEGGAVSVPAGWYEQGGSPEDTRDGRERTDTEASLPPSPPVSE